MVASPIGLVGDGGRQRRARSSSTRGATRTFDLHAALVPVARRPAGLGACRSIRRRDGEPRTSQLIPTGESAVTLTVTATAACPPRRRASISVFGVDRRTLRVVVGVPADGTSAADDRAAGRHRGAGGAVDDASRKFESSSGRRSEEMQERNDRRRRDGMRALFALLLRLCLRWCRAGADDRLLRMRREPRQPRAISTRTTRRPTRPGTDPRRSHELLVELRGRDPDSAAARRCDGVRQLRGDGVDPRGCNLNVNFMRNAANTPPRSS